jgi:hypothetical protein
MIVPPLSELAVSAVDTVNFHYSIDAKVAGAVVLGVGESVGLRNREAVYGEGPAAHRRVCPDDLVMTVPQITERL